MVAAIQLAIMLGAALGGLLLDHLSITATFIGDAVLLGLVSSSVSNGNGPTRKDKAAAQDSEAVKLGPLFCERG